MAAFMFAVLLDDDSWELDSVEAETADDAAERVRQRWYDAPIAWVVLLGIETEMTGQKRFVAASSAEHALVFQSMYAAELCVVFKMAASQTADVFQIQNSAGTVLGGIRADGTPFGTMEKVTVIFKE